MDTHLPGLTACRRIESEAPRKIVETLATAWRLPGGIVAPAWRATAPTQVATDFPLATFDSSGLQIETRTRHRDGVEDVGLTALDSDMHFMTHFTALQRGLAASEGFQFPKISPDSLAGDEWKAYCEAREAYLGQEQSHARDYLESNSQLLPGANHIGFHLVALGPNIHFAISYEVKGSWRRKYSLLVDHPEHGPMELVYTFAVRGSRQQFHSLAPWMDHIVQSTSLEPEGITTAPRKGGGLGRWLLLAAGVGGSLWWFLT